MNSEQLGTVLNDVQARLASLPDHVKAADAFDARVAGIVKSIIEQSAADGGEFARRLKHGGSDARLYGSKFARHGLSVADVEFLHDIAVAEQRAGRGRGPSEELGNAFKAISEAVYLSDDEVRRIDQRALDNLFPRVPINSFSGADRELAAKGMWWATSAYRKAMDSAESGYGQQLVGAEYVRDLWAAARQDSRVFNLIDSFEMTDPTAYLPVEADLPEMLLFSESTSSSASNNTTSPTGSNRVTVSAAKLGINQVWSGELDEDSLIPFVPFLRGQLTKSVAHYMDSLVLNGDTTNAATGNINLDDADPADTKHYLAFDGIRHAGLVDNTGNTKNVAGPLTYALLKGQQSRMRSDTYLQDWGHPVNPADLIYVADPDTADKAAQLDEVITVDKFGPQATILTGQLARIGQSPFISSIAMSKTEADGKVSTTGANNTKGQVVAFNRNGFKVGFRRRVRIETFRDVRTDQYVLALYVRVGFGRYSPTGAASGIECADVLYNITVA